MRIELKCKCGATASFHDDKGVYINAGGRPDNKGRIFRLEIHSDEWQERHSKCLIDVGDEGGVDGET